MRSRFPSLPAVPRRALATAAACVLVACSACSGRGGNQPGAQSPDRQSDAEYDLARDSFQKGQPRAALDHAQKALTLNEDNDKAQYLVAAIHLSFCSTNKGFESPDCRLADAEKAARATLKVNPKFHDASNLLGQILINEKRYKDAVAVLEPLTREPTYVNPQLAWGNLGWAQVLDGQVDAGIASLTNAVTEPRFCVGHYRLGVAYEKKGDFAAAENALSNALSVKDPSCENLQDGWEARARVRTRLGKAADAQKDYERCREISQETATGKTCVKQLGALGGGSAPPASAAPAPAPAPTPPTPQGTSKAP